MAFYAIFLLIPILSWFVLLECGISATDTVRGMALASAAKGLDVARSRYIAARGFSLAASDDVGKWSVVHFSFL